MKSFENLISNYVVVARTLEKADSMSGFEWRKVSSNISETSRIKNLPMPLQSENLISNLS